MCHGGPGFKSNMSRVNNLFVFFWFVFCFFFKFTSLHLRLPLRLWLGRHEQLLWVVWWGRGGWEGPEDASPVAIWRGFHGPGEGRSDLCIPAAQEALRPVDQTPLCHQGQQTAGEEHFCVCVHVCRYWHNTPQSNDDYDNVTAASCVVPPV